jgi:hypothetical protein
VEITVPRDWEDTDPDGPSTSQNRVRETALSEEGAAIAEGSRGAWKLLVLIAAILGGAFVTGSAVAAISAYEAGKAVAPIEKKIDDHLTAMTGERRMMDLYVNQQTKAIESINRKLDALCRASARPAVCLGEP